MVSFWPKSKVKIIGQRSRSPDGSMWCLPELKQLITDGRKKYLKDTTEEYNAGCFQSVCVFSFIDELGSYQRSEMGQFRFRNRNQNRYWPCFQLYRIGNESTTKFLARIGIKIENHAMHDCCWKQNMNWELTIVSGIGIESAGMIPSLSMICTLAILWPHYNTGALKQTCERKHLCFLLVRGEYLSDENIVLWHAMITLP